MEVVQIGDVTTGKNVGQSLYTTHYSWNRKRNPNHRYAIAAIVLIKIVNADGFGIGRTTVTH
jgi:hypothetical protein